MKVRMEQRVVYIETYEAVMPDDATDESIINELVFRDEVGMPDKSDVDDVTDRTFSKQLPNGDWVAVQSKG